MAPSIFGLYWGVRIVANSQNFDMDWTQMLSESVT